VNRLTSSRFLSFFYCGAYAATAMFSQPVHGSTCGHAVPSYEFSANFPDNPGPYAENQVSIGAYPGGSHWMVLYYGGAGATRFNIRVAAPENGLLSPSNAGESTYVQPSAGEIDFAANWTSTESHGSGILTFSSTSSVLEFSITADGEPATIIYICPSGQSCGAPDSRGFALSLGPSPASLPNLFGDIFCEGFEGT